MLSKLYLYLKARPNSFHFKNSFTDTKHKFQVTNRCPYKLKFLIRNYGALKVCDMAGIISNEGLFLLSFLQSVVILPYIDTRQHFQSPPRA